MSPERIEQTDGKRIEQPDEMVVEYRSLVTNVQLATEAATALSPVAAAYLHHKLTSGEDEPTTTEPPPKAESPPEE